MTFLEFCELLSYIVTVIGLPYAIYIFIYERRKERLNDEEELHQRLSDEYTGFLKLVLENADLQLLRRTALGKELDDEQRERQFALFGILISLFERAYVMVYEEKMNRQEARLWRTWEDYMREWCRREDFREALPELLEGEDEDFRRHIEEIAERERAR